MKNIKQAKAPMNAEKGIADAVVSQGARRASEDAPASAATSRPAGINASHDAEVVPRARRQRFTNAEKRRILQEADRCTEPGEIGALMRREGVYSSGLSKWRRQRDAGQLTALVEPKRGPKANPHRAEMQQITQLTREPDSLQSQLDKAQLVIEVQKKLPRCWACAHRPASPGTPDDWRGRTCSSAGRQRRMPRFGRAPWRTGTPSRTHSPWRVRGPTRSTYATASPPLALDPSETKTLLDTLNSERFCDTAPAAVHATLLDEGCYLGSVRTMYRLLAAHGGCRERRDQLAHPAYDKPELLALAPNQVWSWDISAP